VGVGWEWKLHSAAEVTTDCAHCRLRQKCVL
jgi:hypothetical protein